MNKNFMSLLPPLSAGLLSAIVGYASSAILVFQAAIHFGLSSTTASSWLSVLCITMGCLTIYFSLKLKQPILFAWSTAGAVLLLNSSNQYSIHEVYGSIFFSYFLILIFGFSGIFEKIINKIPMSLAHAMLSGILFNFTLNAFRVIQTQALLLITLFFLFLILRQKVPRYTILFLSVCGFIFATSNGLLDTQTLISSLKINWAIPEFHSPQFNLSAIMSIGLPLFIVTMTSQNMSGIATLKAHNYNLPISKVIGWTGLIGLGISCLGGFSMNLSAITAAMCMGPDAHPDPKKRYYAAIVSGIFYLFVGLFAGIIGQFFMALPKELISIIIGFALLGTVTQGLSAVFKNSHEMNSAFLTFLITASGITFLGIGAPFWGIIGGGLSSLLQTKNK